MHVGISAVALTFPASMHYNGALIPTLTGLTGCAWIYPFGEDSSLASIPLKNNETVESLGDSSYRSAKLLTRSTCIFNETLLTSKDKIFLQGGMQHLLKDFRVYWHLTFNPIPKFCLFSSKHTHFYFRFEHFLDPRSCTAVFALSHMSKNLHMHWLSFMMFAEDKTQKWNEEAKQITFQDIRWKQQMWNAKRADHNRTACSPMFCLWKHISREMVWRFKNQHTARYYVIFHTFKIVV